jgi:hypothetical protein
MLGSEHLHRPLLWAGLQWIGWYRAARDPSGSRRHVLSIAAALVLAVVQNHQYV